MLEAHWECRGLRLGELARFPSLSKAQARSQVRATLAGSQWPPESRSNMEYLRVSCRCGWVAERDAKYAHEIQEAREYLEARAEFHEAQNMR